MKQTAFLPPKSMKSNFWQSLNVQVTLLTLALFMAGIWSLSLYVGHSLRNDMQRELGHQQASVATYIGDNIDRELGTRLDALQSVSSTLVQRSKWGYVALQAQLAQLPVFQSLFNGDTFVVRVGEEMVANHDDVPPHPSITTRDMALIQAFIRSGGTEQVFLSENNSVLMAVPLRRDGLRPFGALVGTIRLDAPSFMDSIARSQYGKAGRYMVYSATQQKVVIASYLVGATLPTLEHWLSHTVGTFVEPDHLGRESLVTDQRIRRAPWNVSVALPTEEAFAPAYEQQRRLVVAALVATLLTGIASWLMVRRQLSVLVRTANTLTTLSAVDDLPPQLPLTRQYEADQLITAFNRLLTTLRTRNLALSSSMALGQNTLDSLGVQIAVLAADGTLMAVNQQWQQFAQLQDTENASPLHLGVHYRNLFAPDMGDLARSEQSSIECGISDVLDGTSEGYAIETTLQCGGHTHWFYIQVTPLGKEHKGAVVARTDISERKRADAQIRKLSQIAEQAPLSVVITDLQGCIEYTNPYFSEKTLFSAQEVLGKNPSILKSGQTPASVYQDLWQTLSNQQVWRGELHNQKKNGELFVERAVIAPVCKPDGQVTHYVALKEDVTDERNAENRRLSLSLRVEELSRRLVRTQEETRQRFSQELHDRTSPNLAALRINLDIIANTVKGVRLNHELGAVQDFTDRIEDTRALIEDTNASIREICAGLHPSAIERGGLLGVIQSYALQFSKRTGIQTHVYFPHHEVALPTDLELALFRIFQEALTNCAKHANATAVEVRGQWDGRPIFLSIADNGQGFDPSASQAQSGLGLISMREMVEFIGGQLRVQSTSGQGTQVYVEIG